MKPQLLFHGAVKTLAAEQPVENELHRHGSALLRARIKDSGHGRSKPVPGIGLLAKALFTFPCQSVVLGPPIVVRNTPLRCEHAPFLQAIERGVERSLLHLECTSGDLLNAEQYPISVRGP